MTLNDMVKSCVSKASGAVLLSMVMMDLSLQLVKILPIENMAAGRLVSIIASLIMFKVMYIDISLEDITKTNGKITVGTFVLCFFVFYMLQLPFSLLNLSMEKLFNLCGFTLRLGRELSLAGAGSVVEGLYVCLAAPIIEELLYRGFILKSLKKYGECFTIVISSVLFGLMHTNLTQSVFAFFAGMVLAYVAMRYSVKCSILMHIINNLVMGVGVSLISDTFFPDLKNLITYIIFIIFFLAGLAIIVKSRNKIRSYVMDNKTKQGFYKAAFSSKAFIVFLIVSVVGAFSVVRKI
ncbi:MAG: CPBP family intramembrane metalloprotease [Coprococcus sp.]|nr:CPBP family intramembrane metalloprotease [Coprococcus sp.]